MEKLQMTLKAIKTKITWAEELIDEAEAKNNYSKIDELLDEIDELKAEAKKVIAAIAEAELMENSFEVKVTNGIWTESKFVSKEKAANMEEAKKMVTGLINSQWRLA